MPVFTLGGMNIFLNIESSLCKHILPLITSMYISYRKDSIPKQLSFSKFYGNVISLKTFLFILLFFNRYNGFLCNIYYSLVKGPVKDRMSAEFIMLLHSYFIVH